MRNGLQRVCGCAGVAVLLVAASGQFVGCAQPGQRDTLSVATEPPASTEPRAGARPGPFGLAMGMSKDEIETAIGVPLQPNRLGAPFHFNTPLVPRPFDGAEDYLLLVLPEAGLCRISMSGENVSTDGYGLELRAAYRRLRDLVAGVYGEYGEVDFLFDGSIWDEPEYWMRSLERDERRLSARWSAPGCCGPSSGPPPPPGGTAGGPTMRNNVGQVVISAHALSGDTGFLTLSYWFENDDACTAELDQAAHQADQATHQAAKDVF